MSTTPSSSESTEPLIPPDPPSRDPADLPTDLPSGDPAELTPDLENDIDLSTLRFLTGTLRHTFAPYLGWIVVFTSFAKLTRFSSPYLFRATRWTADWGFYGFEKLIQFLAWGSMWLGMVAAVVWILGGIGLGVAWLAIKMKPVWRKSVQQRPVLTKFAARVVVEMVVWRITRRWIAIWIGKVVLVTAVGLEGYNLLQTASSQKRPTTNSIPSDPVPSTSDKEADEESDSGETAEQWARKVREEMLRDSLLRRGRTTGKESDSQTVEEDT
ncbi:hypothetical protein JCM3765_000453 [Sporobolomyces pararoseus]